MPRPLPPPKPRFNWRMALRLIVWTGVLAGAAWASRVVDSFLQTDSRFRLDCAIAEPTCEGLEIHGAVYASRARLLSVFSPDFGNSVFHITLPERRRRLLAVDWVQHASVSRIWPNRIVVDISERKPVAFAKVPIGGSGRYRFSLIDQSGVLLSLPPRSHFHLPVLSGVTEEQSEADRATRVKAMQALIDELGPRAASLSEIIATDSSDMRVILERDRRAVELDLGDQRFRSRFSNFMSHYEEIRRHSPDAAFFDLRIDDRILAR